VKALEEKAATEGIIYTEEQLQAWGLLKREKEHEPDEIETEHPGYLLAQDTFYFGYLKSLGWPQFLFSICLGYFRIFPLVSGTNKRGKIISLKQQGNQTAKNKNTNTAMIVIRFMV